MSVRKGEFVRVTDTHSEYDGMLGRVRVVRPSGVVEVEFGRLSEVAPSIFKQSEVALTLVNPEEIADFFYGEWGWHGIVILHHPLNTKTFCRNRLCLNWVTQRVLINLYGCVCEADVCDTCARSWAGVRVDTIPFIRQL